MGLLQPRRGGGPARAARPCPCALREDARRRSTSRDRRVLVRVDFNVPLEGRRITDDTRIRAALPTIEELRERGAELSSCSHLGRPEGRDPSFRCGPPRDRLARAARRDVALAPGVVGEEVEALAADAQPGDVLMLENVALRARRDAERRRRSPARYARLADVYVNDAFGAAHRAHASTEGVAHHVEQAPPGGCFEREVETLEGMLSRPARPFVAVSAARR